MAMLRLQRQPRLCAFYGLRFCSKEVKETTEELPIHEKYKIRRYKNVVIPLFSREKEPQITNDFKEMAKLTALPSEYSERKVIIHRPQRKATQTAIGETFAWRLSFTPEAQWAYPLMGWASTSDSMTNLKLEFESKEQAVRLAQKEGWDYIIIDDYEDKHVANPDYTDVLYSPYAKNLVGKYGVKNKHYVFPGLGQSHYARPLNYHGTGEVRQHGPNQQALPISNMPQHHVYPGQSQHSYKHSSPESVEGVARLHLPWSCHLDY